MCPLSVSHYSCDFNFFSATNTDHVPSGNKKQGLRKINQRAGTKAEMWMWVCVLGSKQHAVETPCHVTRMSLKAGKDRNSHLPALCSGVFKISPIYTQQWDPERSKVSQEHSAGPRVKVAEAGAQNGRFPPPRAGPVGYTWVNPHTCHRYLCVHLISEAMQGSITLHDDWEHEF